METLFYDDAALQDLLRGRRSIFLAGPTSRGVPRTAWRARALDLLKDFDGTVVLPEFRDGLFAERVKLVFGTGTSPVPGMRVASHNVLHWETRGIELSTVALFWMPFVIRAETDPESLPGFTTRAEVSRELQRDPKRIVLGMPASNVLSSSHIRFHAHHAGLRVHETLEETVQAAMEKARASSLGG